MKEMLLSFSYEWLEPLKDGRKIFEHRKRFCDEKVKAFIYVGYPIKRIVAVVTLDKRKKIEEWLTEFKEYESTQIRVKKCLKNNTYAMKVLDYQEIEPIDLTDFKLENDRFIVPRSYYWLDNNLKLKEYIHSRLKTVGELRENIFPDDLSDIVCTY